MEITRDLLTLNPFSRPGTKLTSVKGIVLHWVANPSSTASQNRNYFESLKFQDTDKSARYASAHFIIGLKGEIVQCIPVNERAYHVGARSYTKAAVAALSTYPNNCTLGIELCHPDNTGQFTEATIKAAVELCARLCMQHTLIPAKALYRHYDVTGKLCPKYFVDHEDQWQTFIQSVSKSINI